jgi:hypothetical protein
MKKISDEEYENHVLYDSFINNQRFDYIREKIDTKYETFFKKLLELSFPKSRQLLNDNKVKMRDVLYKIVFNRFINNDYLTKTLEIVTNAIRKNESKESSGIVQEIIINSGENNLMPIVNEMFEIPNLVLSAMEKSKNNFEKMIDEFKNRNRFYDIKLFREAKNIYIANKGKKPKITQAEALILANQDMNLFQPEVLRDSNNFDKDFFKNMQDSFRRQINNL